MNDKFSRTIGLIGETKFKKITSKTIMIFGLGGVGGTCFESLVRTGFKKFILIDFDKVDISNLNRQILYTEKDIGKLKITAAKSRALSIDKELKIDAINLLVKQDTILKLNKYKPDFVIDAIDDIEGKIAIAKYAQNKNADLIVSLGMANRVNPSDVIITKLNKTTNDPLAKKLRYEMKKENLDLSKINVAFSKETPFKNKNVLNSTIFVPSSAGLNIASYVFSTLVAK